MTVALPTEAAVQTLGRGYLSFAVLDVNTMKC
jgi:hypothetical protein